MYNTLTSVIAASGIWNGARSQSHAFLLSPSVYRITRAQQKELSDLGYAIYDCLLGLSHIAVIVYDPLLNYGGAWRAVRRVFSTGVPRFYQELQGINVRRIPKLLKVDLMVDEAGKFRIAEIDGHNKHGLGYSTLGLRFRQALYPEAEALPGSVRSLSSEIQRLGHNEVKVFYADQERFYIPEFEVAAQEFGKYGIACQVVSEMEAQDDFLRHGLFLDLPFLYRRPELYNTISQAYKAGQVSFVIPPKPFLGSKGVLALLRNDTGNVQLEALLRSFIKQQSLDLVRRYIPETVLVGKQAEGFGAVTERTSRKRYVLKESISSGMKGTVFSSAPDFEVVLAGACKSNMNWVLQEEVVNQPQTFSWFAPEHGNPYQLKTSSDWFMRVTTQYVNHRLADVIVTARRDKSVHGAKDCLQLGTVVE
jgi:hypothetical protein